MTAWYLNPKLPHPGLIAGREGRYFYGWVNDKSGIAAATVLTDVGFLGELQSNRRYIVSLFYMYCSTLSDWVTTEFGVTVNNDGSGAFTARVQGNDAGATMTLGFNGYYEVIE